MTDLEVPGIGGRLVPERSENSESSGSENFTVGTANHTATTDFVRLYAAFIKHITGNKVRRGQAWMNALHEVDPDLAASIHQTEADCFYDDRKIDAFRRVVFKTGE